MELCKRCSHRVEVESCLDGMVVLRKKDRAQSK